MARSIDYRSTLHFPAEKVYATMTDPDYLRARLREIGGPGSSLLDHEASPESARYELKQGLAEKDLPPVVSKVMNGDTDRAATPAEIATMVGMVDQAMRDGAFGLSTGLDRADTMFPRTHLTT